jgi:hypothetical protein
MTWFKNTYNAFYFGFLISILIVFFYTRPLNSPWNKFIDGDGLGYYSYLPATFIYDDPNYEFKWFNDVHKKNYEHCSFDIPTQNFLVSYKGREINKYYQGLSFIWLPFFTLAHLIAKITNNPADGYSLPYQLCIGLASIFYLFLGLFYLKKLILLLFENKLVSVLIPIALFYGTPLFNYSLQLNSQSHVYSFTFITLFIYFAYSFFNQANQKLKWFLFATLCFVITLCIRPLNGLTLLIIPAFIPSPFFKQKWLLEKLKTIHVVLIILVLSILIYQLRILYIQTNSFIPFTYTDEKFYFNNPRFIEALFSYNIGLFTYTPLFLLSLFGIFYLQNNKQKIILPFVFLLAVYLYSSWWYWPITGRALIDFYPILAILLAAALNQLSKTILGKAISIGLLCLSISYYQLKNYQVHHGILDEFYTHKELFWKNFLKTKPGNLCVIPTTSIIKQETHLENFETEFYTGRKSIYYKKEGNYSAVLDSISPFTKTFDYTLPHFMQDDGGKKIRFSFWCYLGKNISSIQIYFKCFNKENELIKEIPFYLTPDKMNYERWDYKEFGCEISHHPILADTLKDENIDHISIFIWNDRAANEAYVDQVTTEFILTNRDYEIIK